MEKKIRWGILGTGYIARKFAEGLTVVDNAELFAVASRNLSTAEAFANDFKGIKTFGSYEELAACKEIDVVYIATPHNLHYSNTLMCLEQGKNVLCEKPFAVNTKEVQKMIDFAESKNLFLMEAFWTRFLPHIIKIKELIENETIGQITFLKADLCVYRAFDATSRLFNKTLVGGSLLDVGIYPLFLALFLMGEPTAMQAAMVMGQTEVDHSCSISLQYPNAAMAFLYSSVVAATDVTAEIHGSKGKIVLDPFWFCPSNFTLVLHDGTQQRFEFESKGNGYNYEAQEVTNCLLSQKTESDIFSSKDSLQLIKMLDAIRLKCNLFYPLHDEITK